MDRHLSPRFPLAASPNTSISTPTKGYFQVYEDTTTQNLANAMKTLKPPSQEEPEMPGENKENVIKQEIVEEFEDLSGSDVQVKQEFKSGASSVVVRRVFIPSSTKENK